MSERRACRPHGAPRSSMQYRFRPRDEEAVLGALKALAGRHRRSGYRQLTRTLRRRWGRVNHKRVHRLHRKHRLQMPVRRRRRLKRMPRQPTAVPRRPNECWSMDFVHDRTMTGPLRTLSVLDLSRDKRPCSRRLARCLPSASFGLWSIRDNRTVCPNASSSTTGPSSECLNEHVFSNVQEAQDVLEQWRQHYNEERLHGSLGGQTPNEFARRLTS